MNHLICILLYTNFTNLQYHFKQEFRRKYKNESAQEINKRHRYIYHWSRYLNELVVFYGDIMDKNETVYVGLNNKLLFNQLVTYFYCPVSTSLEYNVASSYAATKGVILRLERGHEFTRCFKTFIISDFLCEKEVFFCGSRLKITDFQFKSCSKSYGLHCKAIQLFERIMGGHLFMHKQELLNENVIKILISMIDIFMNSIILNDYNHLYIQQIFNHYVKSYIYSTGNNPNLFNNLLSPKKVTPTQKNEKMSILKALQLILTIFVVF